MVLIIILMETLLMDNGKMIKNMEKELIFMQLQMKNMMDNGKMEISMDLEHFIINLELMKDNLQIILKKVKVNLLIKMVQELKDIGKKIKLMEKL